MSDIRMHWKKYIKTLKVEKPLYYQRYKQLFDDFIRPDNRWKY